MVWIRMNSWEERTHLIEYGIVAALIHQALLERVRNGRRVPAPAALAAALTALLGLVDEGIQALLPSRIFDPRDVLFNALAGFMVIAASLAIPPQRRPGWRVWFLWLLAGAIGWGEGVYWGWPTGSEPKMLQSVPEDLLSGYLGVVVGVTVMGMLQWAVLRRHVDRSGWWVPASLGASAVAGAAILGVGALDAELGWLRGHQRLRDCAGGAAMGSSQETDPVGGLVGAGQHGGLGGGNASWRCQWPSGVRCHIWSYHRRCPGVAATPRDSTLGPPGSSGTRRAMTRTLATSAIIALIVGTSTVRELENAHRRTVSGRVMAILALLTVRLRCSPPTPPTTARHLPYETGAGTGYRVSSVAPTVTDGAVFGQVHA